MKNFLVIFLQVIVFLAGTGVLFFLLWEPQVEGRNQHATFFEIYFKDPFLLYIYIASVSFFIGLYQVFRLLGHIRQNRILSQNALKALRTIKRCALVLITFTIGAEAYFFIIQAGKGEDIAGGVAIGLFIILISLITTVATIIFEKKLQNAVHMKSENDL